MDPIDRNQLLDFIKFDEKVIAPEEHTAQDIVMMIQTAPTITLPPNDPLTLEELREMDIGVWVWIEDWNKYHPCLYCGYMQKMDTPESTVKDGGVFFGWIENDSWHRFYWKDYGKTWLAYRRKPEDTIHG